MAPSARAARSALQVLHYLVPFLVFVYYSVAVAVSVCTLKASKSGSRRKVRGVVLSCMLLVVLSFVVEAALITGPIFARGGGGGGATYATKDAHVYALASVLVWTLLSASLLTSKSYAWFPYYGSWLVSLLAGLVVLALRLASDPPSKGSERAQIAVQGLRIVVLVFLLALYFSSDGAGSSPPDEETAPLLAPARESSDASRTSVATNRGLTTESDDCVAASVDDETTKNAKKEKEALGRLENRLKEDGNWLTYLRGFMVFFPYIWPVGDTRMQLRMLGVGLSLVAVRALNILVPRQLGILVNTLGADDATSSFNALGFYILFNWLQSSMFVVLEWFWGPVDANARKCLDCASYNHIMGLSCDFHDEKQSGELFEAISQGRSVVDLLESLLYRLLPKLADLVLACVYFYFLFDAYMSLIVVATILVYLWGSATMIGLQNGVRRGFNGVWRRQHQVLYDTIGCWKTVCYFNRIPYSEALYAASVRLLQRSTIAYDMLRYYTYGVQTLILDLGLFGACVLAVYQVVYGGKDVGSFITLLTYWGNLSGPLSTLSGESGILLRNLIDAEELLRIFRKKPSVADGPDKMRLRDGQVEFENVSFGYDRSKEIVTGLNFCAKPGQTVAIVGETGAGKSTILKLLFRFYDVTGGSITVDGQDVRNVTLESLRENIGVVPQDPTLFDETIIANLRYARLDATDDEIHAACRAAAVHDKIVSFPEGYMSKVGERGVKLSGGELQRVAIARAILKNPRIILLDEATSSVDSETEAKIQEGLKTLCANRTTFVVAHRLSTVMDADVVLVMRDGKILERGSPAELLRSKGKYYSLWTKQMGIVDNTAAKADEEGNPAGPSTGDGERTPVPVRPAVNAVQSERGASPKHPRPELSRSASSSKAARPSHLGKRAFRPDAPEFVPSSLRANNNTSEDSEGNDKRAWTAHLKGHENVERERKSKARKRKPRTESSDVGASGDGATMEGPYVPVGAKAAADASATDGVEPKPKKTRLRRNLSRSEPPGQSVQQSQGESAGEMTGTPGGSGEGNPPDAPSHRRSSAPSDPPSGSANDRHGGRRRRRPHWRDRENGGPGTAATPGSRSRTSDSQQGSSEPGSLEAPRPTPQGGTTPSVELAQAPLSARGVSFAPGS